jgi:hypothetical protein
MKFKYVSSIILIHFKEIFKVSVLITFLKKLVLSPYSLKDKKLKENIILLLTTLKYWLSRTLFFFFKNII